MRRCRLPRFARILILAGLGLRPAVAGAHHEAIFGPQSSAVFSADRFVSVQVFDRALGTPDSRTHETTALVSAGVELSRRYPLTFTAILPYSWITQQGQPTTSGVEDAVLGLRYRHDLKGLQDKWGRDGNYLMGVGAFELNNGSIDHESWEGPVDGLASFLGSMERGPWSAIGYTVARFNAEDKDRNRDGNHLFVGTGLAYTPNEDFATGRLVSYQVALTFEHYSPDQVAGAEDAQSGGDQLLLQPAITYRPGHDILFFGTVTFPMWRDFRDSSAQDAFRFGSGLVYSF